MATLWLGAWVRGSDKGDRVGILAEHTMWAGGSAWPAQCCCMAPWALKGSGSSCMHMGIGACCASMGHGLCLLLAPYRQWGACCVCCESSFAGGSPVLVLHVCPPATPGPLQSWVQAGLARLVCERPRALLLSCVEGPVLPDAQALDQQLMPGVCQSGQSCALCFFCSWAAAGCPQMLPAGLPRTLDASHLLFCACPAGSAAGSSSGLRCEPQCVHLLQ
jgi:hypothetical protein